MYTCTITYMVVFYRVDERLSIKVADFGLARDVYSTEYYRVEQHVMLPVKWMPLESLMDGYFNEKTDVVSNHLIKARSSIYVHKQTHAHNTHTNTHTHTCMHAHIYVRAHTSTHARIWITCIICFQAYGAVYSNISINGLFRRI